MNQDERERREAEEKQRIVIQDKRHGRGLDSEEEPEPEPTPEPPAKPAAKQAPPELIVTEAGRPEEAAEPQIIELDTDRAAAEPAPTAPSQESAAHDEPPEMVQLKALFGAGIYTYLLSQLDLLFNFALIYMGRVPNPASGMVAVDLKQAKVAIDSLDFVLGKAKEALEPEQLAQITQAVAELKMLYLNAAGGAPVIEPEA